MKITSKFNNFFLFFWLLSVPTIFAQTGSISGIVKDKKTKETIPGANVIIQGTVIGASTDLNGEFKINNVGEGSHNLVVSFISYKTEIVQGIKVKKGQNTIVNIEIEETATQLEAVVIKATKKTDTEISMLTSLKTSSIVMNGISAQQIQKTQDKDAADVVKRMPGITINDDRFVVIRGLNQRYNMVYLNNSTAPSFETDIRAFSFDVLPSSLIDNLVVFKTPAPELPSDFAGGVIAINTKNTSDKSEIIVSAGSSYIEGVSLKKTKLYETGKTEWLGYNDGTLQLPDNFPANLSKASVPERIDWAKQLNSNWQPIEKSAPFDYKFGITALQKFLIKKVSVGNVTAFNYSNSYDIVNMFKARYQSYDTINDKPNQNYYYYDDEYTRKVKISFLHNWSMVWGNNQKLEFRNLLIQLGNNKTLVRDGFNFYGGQYIRGHSLYYGERFIYSGQLGGSNTFNQNRSKLSWNLGFNKTKKDEPDSKMISRVRNDNAGDYFQQYMLNISFAPTPQFCGRIFRHLDENILSNNIQYEQKLFLGNFKPTIKTGTYFEKKFRTFDIRNIGYVQANPSLFDYNLAYLPENEIFAPQNINNTTGIMLQETTAKADSYDADNTTIAGYFGINIPIGALINIYTGTRVEKSRQQLNSYMVDKQDEKVNIDNDTIYFLPSINTTFNLTEKALLRLAYGPTINKPEFREIAPLAFYDYADLVSYRGNINLKNAVIQNIDLRYEYYPTPAELFSLALFYKNFTNPIELAAISTGSGPEYTFKNAEKAHSSGAEIELRKSFENLKNNTNFLSYFKNFTLVFNAAYINSEVIIPKTETFVDVRKRPLQGQSPYIVNCGMFYQKENIDLMISAVYNVIGKRIIVVGYPQHPSIYEMPHNLLDLTISKGFKDKLDIKFGVTDLLNEKIKQQQILSMPYGQRKQTTLEYFPGRTINLSLSYKL